MELLQDYNDSPKPRAAAHSPGTFEKIQGSANDDGTLFETKVATLLWLRGLNSGFRFELAANVKGAGAMDDIVFRYQPKKTNSPNTQTHDWITVFYQLKYKKNGSITRQVLAGERGDFSLRKYFQSFCLIEEKMGGKSGPGIFDGSFDACRLVLFTNAVRSDALSRCTRRCDDNVDAILKTGHSNEVIFGFDPEENADIFESLGEGGGTDPKTFFEKMKVFSGEPSVRVVPGETTTTCIDTLIVRELQKRNNLDTHEGENVSRLFVEEFKRWGRDENTILNEHSDILRRAISKHKMETMDIDQKKRLHSGCRFKSVYVNALKKSLDLNVSFLNVECEGNALKMCTDMLMQALEEEKLMYILIALKCFLEEADVVLSVWGGGHKRLLVIVDDDIMESEMGVGERVSGREMENDARVTERDMGIVNRVTERELENDARETERDMEYDARVIKEDMRIGAGVTEREMGNDARETERDMEYDARVIKEDMRIGAGVTEKELENDARETKRKQIANHTCEMLKMDGNLRVVFVSNPRNAFGEMFKKELKDGHKIVPITSEISHLDDDSLEKILTKEVIFQGESIELRRVVGDITSVTKSLTELLLSVQPHLMIGQRLKEPVDYYMNRTLCRKNVVKMELFESQDFVGVVAVSGVTMEKFQSILSGEHEGYERERRRGTKVNSSLNSEHQEHFRLLGTNEVKDFESLCNEVDTVHWVHFENGQLLWKRSQGSMEDFFKYLDENECTFYTEENVLEMGDKISLLLAEPGMGKSTLVSQLAHQMKKSDEFHWVVCLNLVDFNASLDETVCGMIHPEAFLANAACVERESRLERALFQHCLCRGQVSVLLDGYDELDDVSLRNAKSLLEHLTKTSICSLWVTSRFFMQTTLTKSLPTIPLVLERLSTKDQKCFFANFWSKFQSSMNDDEKGEFVDALLTRANSSMNETEREFAGIPLQTRMLAEVFTDHWINPNKNPLPDVVDVLTLYETFVKHKYDILLVEKDHFDSIQLTRYGKDMYKILNDKHTYASMALLFDNSLIRSLKIKKIGSIIDKFMEDVVQGEERTGIVDKVINGKPHFLHRTFSEYFVGRWMAENINKIKCFESYLFTPGFLVIRRIFDRVLTRMSTLHTAVLNRDTAYLQLELSKLLDVDVNLIVDKGGRTPLHLASAVGFKDVGESKKNLEVLGILLKHGANINLADTKMFHFTPLRYAIETKSFDVVDALLSQISTNKHDLNLTKQTIKNELTVDYIIEHDFDKALSFLLNTGLSLQIIHQYKLSYGKATGNMLHKAAMCGSNKVIRMLVKERVRNITFSSIRRLIKKSFNRKTLISDYVNKPDSRSNRPIHYAASNGHSNTVNLLIRLGANFDVGPRSPLMLACEAGSITTVKLLIKSGVNVRALDTYCRTSLHYAVLSGDVEMVRVFLDSVPEDARGEYVNARDNDGMTAVSLAATKNNPEMVRVLIDADADILVSDHAKWTPLHQACYFGRVVHVLLDNFPGDDVERREYLNSRDKNGRTALSLAAIETNPELVRLLIGSGADVRILDDDGRSPLHHAADSGRVSVVRVLLDNFPDDERTKYVNARDKDDKSALSLVVGKNFPELVKVLIDQGADVLSTDKNKRTPLHFVRHTDVLDVLLDHFPGGHVERNEYVNARDKYGRTALSLAVAENDPDMARRLIGAGCDMRVVDVEGRSPLHHATDSGRTNVVQALLESHPEDVIGRTKYVNARDKDGKTALTLAAMNNHLGLVTMLIEMGAEISVRDSYKRSPVHYAALYRHADVIRALLNQVQGDEKGMRYLDARDVDGDTAYDLAKWSGCPAYVLELLKYYGART